MTRKPSLPHYSQRTRYVVLDQVRRKCTSEMGQYRVTGMIKVYLANLRDATWSEVDRTLLGPYFDDTLAGIRLNVGYVVAELERHLRSELGDEWDWMDGPVVYRVPDGTGSRWRRCGECGTPILVNVGSDDDAAPEVYCGDCGYGDGFRVVLEAKPLDIGAASGALRA